ncbi:hypothetical protein EV126DRAFT_26486 [Verticillium dahliae]|nr:hypothetical protein EV126DRAFT_26486 [Verticillium dahliae]
MGFHMSALIWLGGIVGRPCLVPGNPGWREGQTLVTFGDIRWPCHAARRRRQVLQSQSELPEALGRSPVMGHHAEKKVQRPQTPPPDHRFRDVPRSSTHISSIAIRFTRQCPASKERRVSGAPNMIGGTNPVLSNEGAQLRSCMRRERQANTQHRPLQNTWAPSTSILPFHRL